MTPSPHDLPTSIPAASPGPQTVPAAPISRGIQRHPKPAGGDPLRRIDPGLVDLSHLILNNADHTPQHLAPKRKPAWLKAKVPGGPGYDRLNTLLTQHRLHTVCKEAGCPNMGECWARGVATIMILGDTCTRACGFCNVKTGRPPTLDIDEPRRTAEALRTMTQGAGLRHIVITSVNRDELPDGGAALWAETIRRSHEACPDLSIEALIPDFEGNWEALGLVIEARPEILNHNLETVRRMYPAVRPSAKFDRSLELLRRCKDAGLVTKTGIMVGIGERDEEVLALLDEVQARARADILTIGQYLQPTLNHLPIDRWVTPERFAEYRRQGLARGFAVVESGPLVRSSYHADAQVDELVGPARESYERLRGLVAGSRNRA